MSRQNKVNPDHYTGAGRLSPDDLARERRKQSESRFGSRRGSNKKPMAPWMVSDSRSAHPESVDVPIHDTTASVEGSEQATSEPDDVGAQAPLAEPQRRATGKQAAKAPGSGRAQPRTTAPKKTARRKLAAKPRSKMKASSASGTSKSGKPARARASAARAASPPRARRPGARKTASRGTRKATPKKGTAKKGTARKGTAKAKKR